MTDPGALAARLARDVPGLRAGTNNPRPDIRITRESSVISQWDGDRPKYAEQMKQMQQWLDEAKAKGIRKAFINFHYPVFARSGLGPIPAATADSGIRNRGK